MKRREFIRNTSLSLAAISLSQTGNSLSYLNGNSKKNITAGFHVWVYAKTLPGYDVSPVLKQIFSDVSYAGFDGVEIMPEPLRKAEYTKQIGELKEQFKIALIGSSYGADLWDKEKHNQILEDVNLVMSNLASLGGRTFGTSVGRPKGRVKTD
jgi:sugar phosphate isomerase/epimerase